MTLVRSTSSHCSGAISVPGRGARDRRGGVVDENGGPPSALATAATMAVTSASLGDVAADGDRPAAVGDDARGDGLGVVPGRCREW